MNLMELYIKIMADDQATSKIEDVAEKTNGLASKMGAGLATAAKIGGAAVTATAGGVAMLAKKATDAYSSFEQLKGGVETLFREASDTVIANAEKAFATSGTSMNQYMETVTSFAASLIQATGRGEQTDLEELETALENRLEATKESLEEEYDARKEYYNDIYKDQQQANKDEYDELKRSLDAQYEERKAYWDAVLNGSDSKQAKEEQKQARDDELKNLKQANSDKLAAVKAANAEQLKSTKDTLKAEVEARKDYYEQLIEAAEGADAKKALRAQRDAEIKSMKESNTARETALKNSLDQEYKDLKASLDAQYNARKDYWADAIKSTTENATADKEALKAQKEAELKEIKEAQKAQLEAYKKGQAAELAALKTNNEKELKELKSANKKSLKVTEQANKDRLEQVKALNQQSETTSESLQEAARLADMALQDMSDNANKMGTAMASIQNAYQGFAKANYTMLDNLKLGYGGTKEEMRRLLEDAERLAGVKFDLSSYADIVQAIHVIQQEMGITGTTAAEASATITGSMSALKASLENLFVSISSGDRIQESFKNLFDTAVAFGQNYFPRIEQSIEGIVQLIPEAIPLIFEKVPEIVDKEVPKVVESATGILNKIVEVLSNKESINKLTSTATNTITTLANALAEATPDLMVGAARIITNVVGILADPEQISKLLAAGGKIITGLMTGIGESYEEISKSISLVVSAMSAYLRAPENIQTIKMGAEKLISDFLSFLTNEDAHKSIGATAGDIMAWLITSIGNLTVDLLEAATDIFDALGKYLSGEDWDSVANDTMKALAGGWEAFFSRTDEALQKVYDRMTAWFESIDWWAVGKKIMELIVEGMRWDDNNGSWGAVEGPIKKLLEDQYGVDLDAVELPTVHHAGRTRTTTDYDESEGSYSQTSSEFGGQAGQGITFNIYSTEGGIAAQMEDAFYSLVQEGIR